MELVKITTLSHEIYLGKMLKYYTNTMVNIFQIIYIIILHYSLSFSGKVFQNPNPLTGDLVISK